MRAFAVLVLACGAARADELPRVEVQVGATVERNVAYARGWMCDDPSLVTAEMATRDDHNVWIIKGVKVGNTQCRVGLDRLSVCYVFDVHVVAKPKM
jgi:hypothetical protein